MKQFIFAIITLVLTACTEYTIGYDKDELLSLSTDKIEMEYDGGQASVEIESICSWDLTIGSSCDWVHSSVNHGNGGKNSVTITIDKNKTITPRSATITISNEQCNISYQIAIEQKAGTPNLEVSSEELAFTYESGAKGLKIISNIDYTITSSQEWCTIDTTKGGSGEKELQVSVTKNSTIEPRSAMVKIENSEYKIVKEVNILQSAAQPAIDISSSSLSVPVSESNHDITITSNITWEASCEDEWISLSPKSGASGTNTLNVRFLKNPGTTPRTSKICITNKEHNLTKEIDISQAGGMLKVEESQKAISAPGEGGDYSVTVTSNISWSASSPDSWVNLSQTSGLKGDATLKVNVAKNSGDTSRSSKISITNEEYGFVEEINITQEGFVVKFEISNFDISATANSNVYTVNITSNIPWSASCSSDWVALSPSSGGASNTTTSLNISIDQNTSTSSRSTKINVTNEEYGITKEISITQAGFVVEFSVNKTSISASSNSGTYYATITSNITWQASCSASWVTLSPTAGSSGTTSLKITIANNTTNESRSTIIKISNEEYGIAKEISITQAGFVVEFSVNKTSISASRNSGTYYATITSNITWQASCSASWVTLSPSAGSSGSTSMAITVDKSNTPASRSAQITIKNTTYGVCKTISVVQDSASVILYTSSNGKIIEPSTAADFGANIVSNTYSNGQGVIVFDNPITSIGSYAFYDCRVITSITIPNSVKTIGWQAFLDCRSLESVTMPENLTKIESYAFAGCYVLSSIVIPRGVTEIGDMAFYACGLTHIYCKPTTPPATGSRPLGYDPFSITIYVPRNSVSAYLADDYWQILEGNIVGYDF